jgi:hypothetical protein
VRLDRQSRCTHNLWRHGHRSQSTHLPHAATTGVDRRLRLPVDRFNKRRLGFRHRAETQIRRVERSENTVGLLFTYASLCSMNPDVFLSTVLPPRRATSTCVLVREASHWVFGRLGSCVWHRSHAWGLKPRGGVWLWGDAFFMCMWWAREHACGLFVSQASFIRESRPSVGPTSGRRKGFIACVNDCLYLRAWSSV